MTDPRYPYQGLAYPIRNDIVMPWMDRLFSPWEANTPWPLIPGPDGMYGPERMTPPFDSQHGDPMLLLEKGVITRPSGSIEAPANGYQLGIATAPRDGQEIGFISGPVINPKTGRNYPALRLGVTPRIGLDPVTGVADLASTGNGASVEIRAVGQSSYGGFTTERNFLVNGGQEALLMLGKYQGCAVSIATAFRGVNAVTPIPVTVRWEWVEAPMDSLAVHTTLVSRPYQVTVNPVPGAPTRIAVPSGAIRIIFSAPVYAEPVTMDYPTATAATSSRGLGGTTPITTFDLSPAGGDGLPVTSKFIDLSFPVGWPYTTLGYQYILSPI